MTLINTLSLIREHMQAARTMSPLARPDAALLAASKQQPAAVIEQAIAAGINVFGENRVQEAQEKWPELKTRFPHVSLHLIGALQTNKVKQAVQLFDVIQTVDRPAVAEALAKALQEGGEVVTRQCYIQVNTGREAQKAGVLPEEADAFIEYCRDQLKLPVVGLMCIPPADQPAAPHFAWLSALAQRHGLIQLSMGMSDDYETALRLGATCVRIGTALFGARS